MLGGIKRRAPGSHSHPLPVGCAPPLPGPAQPREAVGGLEGAEQRPSLPRIQSPFSRVLGPEFQEGGLSKEGGRKAVGRALRSPAGVELGVARSNGGLCFQGRG